MTATQALLGAGAAIVVFWIVGAYNRMVRLRSTLVGRFAAVDVQYRERQALLEAQHALLTGALAGAAPRLEALRAACSQVDAAREKARLRPGAAGTITSLRLAERILADARSRLPVQGMAGSELPELNARLAACDTGLGFARREFNEAVAAYNEAVAQFPTWFVARLFSFRAAAPF
ncbi:MAG: LemA family protein [Caldimonas sp.]